MEYFPIAAPCPLELLPPMALLADVRGLCINGVALLSTPLQGYLTFCDRLPAGERIDRDCASLILVPHDLQERLTARFPAAVLIAVKDPRALFIDTLGYLQKSNLLGITSLLPAHPVVSPEAVIGEHVVIEHGVQVDPGVTIGNGSIIRNGTWLKRGVLIGENTVLGSTGINAYLGKDAIRRSFPHVAGLIIGEDVSIGASCVLVKGILSSTTIGARSIIGNLCNIGHGVDIDKDVWIAAGTLIGGHTKIGNKATIAIGSTIRDNVTIGARANVGMGSVVTKDVRHDSSVFGNPAKSLPVISAGPSR